jgi:AmmeMemoRadiSam system protein A
MAPSPSPETLLGAADAEALLDIAEATLAAALADSCPILPAVHELPPALQTPMGVFVSLHVAGRLNGCIGTIEGAEPLGQAVARLALSSAFRDPRLPPLERREFADLTIEVSLLSPFTPILAESRAELIAALRPGVDGVAITVAGRHALFLPVVWEQLPRPEDFLDHLWLKAGLDPREWAPGTCPFVFAAERYERRVGSHGASTAALDL